MDAITPATATVLTISLESGRILDTSCCLIGLSFGDPGPSVDAREFVSPSMSVPVIRRMGAIGGEAPLELDLDGMPSFSAASIEKSCGAGERVPPVIGGTT
jgi:hypothetical protein